MLLQKRTSVLVSCALIAFAGIIGALVVPSAAVAVEGVHVVRIEEDWELTISTPDADSVAPQVTTSISPLGHVNGLHATFELNHQTAPDFAAGGVHVHLWNGEQRLASVNHSNNGVARTGGEVVRWTQVMSISDGHLKVEVKDGTSTTWGNFGGGNLMASVATTLTNLDGYSPDVTVSQSGVGFAGNRVQSFKMTGVRAKLSTGQVVTDHTVRVVH